MKVQRIKCLVRWSYSLCSYSTMTFPELSIPQRLHRLQERWASATPREIGNAHLYITELCDALGVERPRPAGSGYEFEYPVKVVGRHDGVEASNRIDLYKMDCFVLEAKDQERDRSKEMLLQKAFGQAHAYARALPGTPPPYLLVLDVASTLLIWNRWSGSYGSFAAAMPIDLKTLASNPTHIHLVRAIWEDPGSLNPITEAAGVTEEIARQLAELARSLERRGFASDRVARFLMRCVFTMFAQDTKLLQKPFFTEAIDAGLQDPENFTEGVEILWKAMDSGLKFYFHRLLRFNGRFFRNAEVIPLRHQDLSLLLQAARARWRKVEPAIFGTLLTRALDPEERHRLGAEYTPRSYVERVILPTIEEPVRERWMLLQAEVLQLTDSTGKTLRQAQKDKDLAVHRLREFHEQLLGLRILDPACGSGNFLYVALHSLKRIEKEIFQTIAAITGQYDLGLERGVGPWQFHGIEVKEWAREIAELTLWIGYHQIWIDHHPDTNPPEPILKDTGTLDWRDAVLIWDGILEDPDRSRPDPTPRLRHPVSGRLVPDPDAKRSYQVHLNARPAEWPVADFIIGNPPYMGQGRQRDSFGDGYVDALRSAYPEIPDSADYVMYWWFRASVEVSAGRAIRAGLITTNSITQAQNRPVIERADARGARVTWAVPDHPWVDEIGAADIRVAMTVIAKDPEAATLVQVNDQGETVLETRVERLNSDLTAHADVASAAAKELRGNAGLASPGFKLHGSGFVLSPEEAQILLAADVRHRQIIRPYRNGRDLAGRPRLVHVIDFGMREEREAARYPVLYDLVRTRVKPERDANSDRVTREKWWRFGRNREELRPVLESLARYIVTVETTKHRVFTFLPHEVAPDNTLVCIASDDAFHLGVLSSRIHMEWALAAGSRLGVGNDPRYNKSRCFDSFPFPDATSSLRREVAAVAEELDALRAKAIAGDARITLTGIYNVLEKARRRESFTEEEGIIHTLAACGQLLELHESLDDLVAEAYGWPWPLEREEILDRLVALHAERREEEARGQIRWIRPELQVPKLGFGFMEGVTAPLPSLQVEEETPIATRWPKTVVQQIAALKKVLSTATLTKDEIAASFVGAQTDLLLRHLETLLLMGEIQQGEDGRYFGTAPVVRRLPIPPQMRILRGTLLGKSRATSEVATPEIKLGTAKKAR